MSEEKKRFPKCITVIIVLYAAGVGFRFQSGDFPLFSLSVLVCCAACIYWAVSIRLRITHARQRRLLISIAGMILLLHFLQFLRYNFADGSPVFLRYLWYLYYIPMILAPLFGLWAAVLIGRPENERPGPGWLLLSVPALILIAGVLTNDLHYLVFAPDPPGTALAGDYTRGILFYIVSVWNYGMPVFVLLAAFRRCSVTYPRKHALRPLLVTVTGFLFMLIFYGSASGGRKIFGIEILTFQMLWNMMQVFFWEECIFIGLIPSNIDHGTIFKNSRVRALILDNNGNTVFSSNEAGPVPEKVRKKTGNFIAVTDEDTKICGRSIPGGFIYWQEDMSAVTAINRELAETGRRLQEENTLISGENELKSEQARLETANRLYDEIDAKVSPKCEKVKKLLSRTKDLSANESDTAILLSAVITAYIKRTANLMLVGREKGSLSTEDLKLALNESLEYAKLYGIMADAAPGKKADYPLLSVLSAYDLFEEILENGFYLIGAFMVWIETKEYMELRMELAKKVEADEDRWMIFKERIRDYAVKTGGYRLFSMDSEEEETVMIRASFSAALSGSGGGMA
ncbi:MAG: hypothetical protein K6F86_09230 [Lachnospiraceae bacterium]|nr:hypothetical protein [Lachnospiraceae bacterium]